MTEIHEYEINSERAKAMDILNNEHISKSTENEEWHPLHPFLPQGARILFLGSFPPPRARWSMDFFYPNWINDFWRIMGLLFFDDKAHFEIPHQKKFDRESIISFAENHGLAFFDTALKVRRQRGNASDNFLEVLQSTDVAELLRQMPHCKHVVTTGGKASELMMEQLGLAQPPSIGDYVVGRLAEREIQWWRMPSTSRAYPLALPKKAEFYAKLFQ